jgi:hypothetical protein
VWTNILRKAKFITSYTRSSWLLLGVLLVGL